MRSPWGGALLALALAGCRTSSGSVSDGGADVDSDTGTQDTGAEIPETCEQAEQTATTVGCLFYAVDLHSAQRPQRRQNRSAE